jgi:hypothetical protein
VIGCGGIAGEREASEHAKIAGRLIAMAVVEQKSVDVVTRILEDRPIFHEGGKTRWDSLPGTLRAIKEFVRPGDRTLETGVGASTVVFASGGAVHTAISPSADEHERVSAYCRSIGVDDSNVTFVVGCSDDVLPTYPAERVLDAAFIDGAHSFPYPAIDWYYVFRSLKIGGRLLLDDIPVPAVASVFHFMQSEPNWRLDSIHDQRTALFTLVSEAAPEDWTLQPFNRRLDFAFAPFPDRVRLHTAEYVRELRQYLSRRHPKVRDAWHRVPGVNHD